MMFAGSLVLVSCSGSVRYKRTHQPAEKTEVVVTEKNGPPPHAPAHGYRHKHGKVVLVYHSELDLYVVDGHDGYYFYEGAYFRSHKGKWQKSADMKGPWKKVSDSRIPKGLKPDQHAKAKGKKKH
jgi:hypothetical protein